MKRIVSTWPYVLGVAILVLGWLGIAKLPFSSEGISTLVSLWIGTIAPLTVTAGGVILALRRRYDWVTVVTCLVAWLILALVGSLLTFGAPPAWDATAAATLAYLVLAHVGVVAVLAFRRMDRNGTSAGT
jgi:hypothetical protein